MRVAEYDSPQVQQQGLPDVRAQAAVDPAGQAVGEGLQQLGQGVERGADDILEVQRAAQKHADEIAKANLDTQFGHDGTTLMQGNQGGTAAVNGAPGAPAPAPAADADIAHQTPTGPSQAALEKLSDPDSGVSQKGLLNEEGQAAAKYAHPTLEALAKRRDEIAAAAPNDRVRQMFLESSGRQLEEYRLAAERHTSQQLKVAGEQALLARSAMGLNTIGTDISAPGVKDSDILYSLDTNTEEVARTIQAIHPGELGDQQAAAYKQQATALVMKHYIDAKDFRGAQNLFDQRRTDLGDQADGFAKTIKLGADTVAADGQAKQIIADAEIPGTGLKDMVKIDKALLDPDKKLTPQARLLVENYKGVAAAQNRGVAANHSTALWSQYDQHSNAADVDPAEIQWAKDNDHDLYKKFQDQVAEDARNRARAVRTPKGSTPEQDVQFNTWLFNHDRNRADYKDMTPEQLDHDYRGRVTQPQLQKMQDALREDKGQKPTSADSTPAWQRDRVWQKLNGDSSTGGKGNPALDPGVRGRVYNAIDEALRRERAAAKANGKDLNGDDVDRIATEQLAKVKVADTGIFSDDKVPAAEYLTNPKYRGKGLDETPAVPDSEAKAIRASFAAPDRANPNPNPTDAQVADIYRQSLERKAGAPPRAPAAQPAATEPEQNFTPASGPDAQLVHPSNRAALDEAQALVSAGPRAVVSAARSSVGALVEGAKAVGGALKGAGARLEYGLNANQEEIAKRKKEGEKTWAQQNSDAAKGARAMFSDLVDDFTGKAGK